MCMKLTTLLIASLHWGMASAVINLRNGPKDLSVDLNGKGLVGTSDFSHARRQLAMRGLVDFEWEVQPEPDYPSISFEDASDDNEVRFLYNYTGTTIPGTKYLKHELFRGDCKTPASTDAVVVSFFDDLTELNEYQVDVNILQESVAGTPEYMDIDVTAAMINFCIRVDYMYDDGTEGESVNFHETNVTINIDLTANFTLTAINVDRISADQVDEDIALNCEVQAYFCNENNENVEQPTFVQGEIMTVCVEIAESDKELYHLNDILNMDLEQIKANGIDTDQSSIVVDQRATGLSVKFCQNGICNIRHQLASKFFDERDPNNLDIAGVAICAFGPLSEFTKRTNREMSTVFATQNTPLRMEQPSVESCKTECLEISGCQAFSAEPIANDFYECLFFTAFPRDEDLATSTAVDVYTRNDVIAPL
mmetsp:Transcript_18641/g.37377  ORF Transcript_18641/g.37377 Transcript_18641/m.37377 type:complete len:423 (-) Transcript_18641:23-1291(-)